MRKPTIKSTHKKFWDVFSEFIRRRDLGRCFTCGTIRPWKEMQAGHYIHGSVCGKYNPLFFNEWNVHCQCQQCNKWKGGQLTEYAFRLVQKYGKRIIEALQKLRYQPKRLNIEEMVELTEYYKKKLKDLP